MALPLAAAIGTTALGLGAGALNIGYGQQQMKKGQELYEKQLEALRSGKFDLSMSQAMADAANQASQFGEMAARQAAERGQAQTTAGIMAARGGDPRMASGLGSQIAGSDQAIRDAQMQGLQMSIGAQSGLAQAQQGILNQNQLFRQGLESQEMQRGAAAAEAGRNQRMMGTGQMFQAPIQGLQMGAAVQESGLEFARGGGIPKANKGMMTPGEFSHKRNPIHMIDKNGDKVGEATGGELIFNPKQTEAIESLIEDGNANMLMMFMRRLLNQPQFQEESRSMNDGGSVPMGYSDALSINPAMEAFLQFLMKDKSEKEGPEYKQPQPSSLELGTYMSSPKRRNQPTTR